MNNQPIWKVWTPPALHGGLLTLDNLIEADIRRSQSKHSLPCIPKVLAGTDIAYEDASLATSDDDKLQMVRLANYFQGNRTAPVPGQPVPSGPVQYVSTGGFAPLSWNMEGRTFKLLEALRAPDGRNDYFDCAVEVSLRSERKKRCMLT